MDTLLHDLRYALRKLRTTPASSLVAIACIAVGIGATTAIFSLVNELLLRPVPGVSGADRVIDVGRSRNGSGADTFSWATFADLRDGTETIDLAAWRLTPMGFGSGDAPDLVLGAQVTEGYFAALGTAPHRGRFFAPGETGPGAGETLVVVSHAFWQETLEGREDAIGREVTINGVPATVIGVTPPGFIGNMGLLTMQAWIPMGPQGPGLLEESFFPERRFKGIQVIGRIEPGVERSVATAELEASMASLVQLYPDIMEGYGVAVAPIGSVPGGLRSVLTAFMGVLLLVVFLVLVVACVNVAGLLLARGAARTHEMALRLSLGAPRKRIVRELLAETLTLFLLGGAGGILLAVWSTGLLRRLDPPTPPPYDMQFDLSLDWRVLGFALVMVLGSALVFGLGPALRASRPDLLPVLRDEPASSSPRRARGRKVLLAGQVGLTILLLVMSALFLRALGHASSLRLGFETDDVYSLGLNLELAGLDREGGIRFLRDAYTRLESIPGLEQLAATRIVPLGLPERIGFGSVNAPGVEPPAGWRGFSADVNIVGPGYFETLEMPLLEGRGFNWEDDDASPEVAVINATMARGLWPDEPATGKTFTLGGLGEDRPIRVAGVAADAKYASLTDEDVWFIYLPIAQQYRGALHLLARGRPESMRDVAAALVDLEPALPRPAIMPLQDQVEVASLPQTLAALVSGVLGLVGLLLATMGVYGVTAYAAAQRTREVGVRVALGARRGQVEGLVLRQGLMGPLLGAAVGLLLAVPVSLLLRSFLLGIPPLDPISFLGATTVLVATAALASWLPARRAARVDPVNALKSE